MNCQRCGTPMMHAQHREVEQVAEDVLLVTTVLLHECPVCSVTVRVSVPVIPVQTLEH